MDDSSSVLVNPSYQASSSSTYQTSPSMEAPLLNKSNSPVTKRKRLLTGSLLPNFVIPTPYSRKNKVMVSFSIITVVIVLFTVAAVLALLLNKRTHFGGISLYKYFFIVSGVLLAYVLLMFVVTSIMRIAARFSKRFRYYASPFAVPLYTCIWAALCFEFLPVIVPEINHPSEPTRVLKEFIRIAASCSIVSAAGIILLIVVERIVYGELAERLWNVLWTERCVALVALENDTSAEDGITQNARPENVLSLAHVIRATNHGLVVWLGLQEWDSKDDKAHSLCASNIANMIMRRRDTTNRGCLYLSDIRSVPDLRPSDATNVFRLFNQSAQGFASLDDIKNAVEVILLEKKFVIDMCMSRSLIIGIFHQIIRALVTTVIVVIVLVILLQVEVYTMLVGLGTAFIGLGFALSTTIQGLLASLQMIFFVRPFEIGDLVKINDGPPMFVEKVGINSTFFYTLDGYGIYYPNAELARSRISNWKRSKDVTFDIPLYLAMETNAEHLSAVKHRVQMFMDNHPQLSPKFALFVSEFAKTCMTVIIKVTLKTTWQEKMHWMPFASELRVYVIGQVVELGIQYQRSEIFKNVPWEPQTVI